MSNQARPARRTTNRYTAVIAAILIPALLAWTLAISSMIRVDRGERGMADELLLAALALTLTIVGAGVWLVQHFDRRPAAVTRVPVSTAARSVGTSVRSTAAGVPSKRDQAYWDGVADTAEVFFELRDDDPRI